MSAESKRADSPVDGYLPAAEDNHKPVLQHNPPARGGHHMFLLGQKGEEHQEIFHYELLSQLKILEDKIKTLESENGFLKEKLRQHACRAEKNASYIACAAVGSNVIHIHEKIEETAMAVQSDAKTRKIYCSNTTRTPQTADTTQGHSGALLITAFVTALGLIVFSGPF
ncbi:uncharacterized protein CC84DRAFT_723064 [Paraphaeosphaeria sporulosa]|uniref:Uncharacterized protein n=1 Tax=Paraphaeosphaeria sporulosa TaxID=1460663 RepID=A0A177CCS2_9PLEO|nr:uncharacterized protein CC84DRAFT_723064 [Paraphaeosphaeria sporulosa]OAG05454.1 hypothetical protein CC84DRAFT_723064 [Paraphaeosphaeria sporulosa]